MEELLEQPESLLSSLHREVQVGGCLNVGSVSLPSASSSTFYNRLFGTHELLRCLAHLRSQRVTRDKPRLVVRIALSPTLNFCMIGGMEAS